jgi:hypothetical protein
MRNIIIALCLLSMASVTVWGQQLAYSWKMDTTLYEEIVAQIIRGPENEGSYWNQPSPYYISPDFMPVYRKKTTNQYDLYSFAGKIGSITIPISDHIDFLFLSQTFIDADTGWECIVIYYSKSILFNVFDENGNKLLADTGTAFYGFDGYNTYVCSYDYGFRSFKSWRFRTNVSTISPGGLAKSTSSPRPMMTYLPNGNFRVSLQPTSSGQTSIQIFDMLGRQCFSKTIQDLQKTQSFIVPSGSVPRSPFVAKANNADRAAYGKAIPVH